MKYFYLISLLFISVISHAQIVNIPDANFKDALVNSMCVDIDGDNVGDIDADTNDDGEIQLTEAEAIVVLTIFNRNISSIEGIQSFINLEELHCWGNQITTIDLSQNTSLIQLYCRDNQLTSLNVSQNINLRTLSCWINQLTSIDVSQNINLEYFICNSNQLTDIDISLNPNILGLYCESNLLTYLNIANGGNTNFEEITAYDNPSLFCIQVDDVAYANSSSWQKDNWAVYSENCSLGIEEFINPTFMLYPNPTLEVLNIKTLEKIENIKIYTINGSLIRETSNSSINISELHKGLYFVRVSINNKTLTKKFIKS